MLSLDPALRFKELRKDFPMLQRSMHGQPLIYFDSAATAQKPQVVIDTICDFYQKHYGTVHRAVYELASYATEHYQMARETIRRFLNAAHVEEIIYTRGTTESINLVATVFGKAFIKRGDRVLISALEHHSNIVPWQMMCEERGATLLVIPVDDRGDLIQEEYQKLLQQTPKMVSLTHVSNALGTINPIKEMIALAHAAGAKVLIDGAQATPHLPIDVQDLDADFYVFSGHKVCGPTGIGVLYGKRELLDALPPYQGGGDMIETVTFEKTTYNTLPLKFEAGTPMIAEVMGLGVAIDYLSKIGMKEIAGWEHLLLTQLTDQLSQIPGLRIIGNSSQKGAIVSFTAEGAHPLDIGTLLDVKGVAIRTGHHCAQPVMRRYGVPATARASLAFYNTQEEVALFAEYLKDVLKVLRG